MEQVVELVGGGSDLNRANPSSFFFKIVIRWFVGRFL